MEFNITVFALEGHTNVTISLQARHFKNYNSFKKLVNCNLKTTIVIKLVKNHDENGFEVY